MYVCIFRVKECNRKAKVTDSDEEITTSPGTITRCKFIFYSHSAVIDRSQIFYILCQKSFVSVAHHCIILGCFCLKKCGCMKELNFSVSHPCQIKFSVSHSWCQIKFDRQLFRRPPTVWFYFLKKVLVLCKSAVYLFCRELNSLQYGENSI